YPPPPVGSRAEVRQRRRARLDELMRQSLAMVDERERVPAVEAGLAARLQEPDVEAMIEAEPPGRVADRLCRSLGIIFHGDTGGGKEPDEPDTG
ncbi:hypothetical protein, partial [Inquilinus limosus]